MPSSTTPRRDRAKTSLPSRTHSRCSIRGYCSESQGALLPSIPLDVMYIDKLPPFAAAGPNIPIAEEAAFVSFKDRLTVGDSATHPLVNILALQPNEPLSPNNVSPTVQENPPAPSPFELWNIEFSPGLSVVQLQSIPQTHFTSASCTPTFAQPCAINYININGVSLVHDQIVNLFAD